MDKVSVRTYKIKKSQGEIIFDVVVYVIAALFCVYCLYPFAIILGSSFETESNFATYGFPVIPRDFSLKAYKMVLGDSQIFKAYEDAENVGLETVRQELISQLQAFLDAKNAN